MLLSPEPSPSAAFSGAEPLRLDSSPSPEKMAPVPWHRKVTTRFFLWLFLALSLGFFILGYQIDRAEERAAIEALSSRLHSESTLLLSALVRFLEKGDLSGARTLFDSLSRAGRDQAVLFSPDGRTVLLSSRKVPAFLLKGQAGLPAGFHQGRDERGRRVFLERFPLTSRVACQDCPPATRLGTLVFYSDGKDFASRLNKGRWARFWMFSGILETLVLVVLLLIRRSLVRPLDGLSQAIARVTPEDPDLRLSFPRTKDDELGRLVFFLNRFVDLFRGWMGEVSDRVRWVEAHADLLERDHERRYRKEEEVRLSLNELRLRVRDLINGKPRINEGEIAGDLSYFMEKSKKIRQVSESVHDSVREAQKLSKGLALDGESLARMRRNLSEAFNGVGEISRELHLTGINAAIEASHAGAHGRTFRIVADTVADLSRKTEGAVNSIGTELSTLTSQLERVVTTLDSGGEEIDTAGRRLVKLDEHWKLFFEALGRLEIQWEGLAERISSETEALLKIQAILDSLSEDFREQLGQKPLEERHLGEIRKVVGELNAEIERFRI